MQVQKTAAQNPEKTGPGRFYISLNGSSVWSSTGPPMEVPDYEPDYTKLIAHYLNKYIHKQFFTNKALAFDYELIKELYALASKSMTVESSLNVLVGVLLTREKDHECLEAVFEGALEFFLLQNHSIPSYLLKACFYLSKDNYLKKMLEKINENGKYQINFDKEEFPRCLLHLFL